MHGNEVVFPGCGANILNGKAYILLNVFDNIVNETAFSPRLGPRKKAL